MNNLSIYSLAIILVLGTSAALAGERRHGGHGYKQHHPHYKQKHQYYKRHHYWHYPRHNYRRHYYPRYRGAYGYYYPPYLGAALVGSALTHSLYHTHQGAVCYDNHQRDADPRRGGSSREVVGCHRIERLPDGSERRVEVPLSECY